MLYAWLLFSSIVVAVALTVAIHASNKATYASQQAEAAVRALAQNVESQTANRTANVATWCTAINKDRDDRRTRSLQAAVLNPGLHIAPFTLRDLNCKALEQQTAHSGTKSAR